LKQGKTTFFAVADGRVGVVGLAASRVTVVVRENGRTRRQWWLA
jgi:hypothetical protein